VGFQASASGSTQASAFGYQAQANADRATSVGYSAIANTVRSTAVGDSAVATGYGSVALGNLSNVGGSAQFGVAIGYQANATGQNSGAIGFQTIANQANALAVGTNAVADNAQSTAIGYQANTSKNNQVMLGGAGSSVAIGDIDASSAAQTGQLYAVTVDDSGTLGKGSALASAQAVQSLSNSMRQVASFHEAEISAINGRLDGIDFALQDLDESTRGGIATSMAMGGMMIVPDSTISISLNGSTYRGEQGFAGGITARVAPKVYVSGTIAGSTAKKSTGARVGVAFGF
jgi:hypothetical protein